MTDRTKIHPRYWHRDGRALAIRDARDDLPLAGSISEANAIEQSRAHADALIREGWLACCKWLRDYPAHPDDTFADVVDAAESQAPGEAE